MPPSAGPFGLVLSATHPTQRLYSQDKIIDYWTDRNKRSSKPCHATCTMGVGYEILPDADLDGVKAERVIIGSTSTHLCSVSPEGILTETHPSRFYWLGTSGTASLPLAGNLEKSLYDAYLVLRSGNSVPKGQNWLRAAIELKDTKQTLQGTVDFCKFGIRMPGMINSRWRTMSISDVAKAYLTYKFGIQPTVSDVRRFLNQLATETLRVRSVKRYYRRGETVRVGINISPQSSDLSYASGWRGPKSEVNDRYFCGCSSPWGAYSCHITPKACGYDNLKMVRVPVVRGVLYAKVAESVEVGGISLNDDLAWACPLASTAYQLTPFTFLLDWVVDVGSVIQRLDRTAATAESRISFEEGVWQSLRVCTSLYYPYLSLSMQSELIGGGYGYPYEWTSRYAGTTAITGCQMLPLLDEFTYDRQPYLITGNVFAPSFRWPIKGYQLSTGMAMLLSFLKDAQRAQRRR